MAINVRDVERDQLFLMPPSLRDWLPEDHLAWFVLDVVDQLDLAPFFASHREDGRGGASYHPSLLLAVLLYAYCMGERSSRRIERRLREDIAFRVLAVNQLPDHATLARFLQRHEQAIAEVFSQVLALCVKAGLVGSGVVAIDGTKIEANASGWSNRSRAELVKEILDEATRTDAEEDKAFGDRRGDELPTEWASQQDRRVRVREALRQLESEGASDLESHLAERAKKEAALGRRLPGRPPGPKSEKTKTRFANTTDPDSRRFKVGSSFVQGYNAQTAVAEGQVIVAAEVSKSPADATNLLPMTTATKENLARAGSVAKTFVADAGYWSTEVLQEDHGVELLVAPMLSTTGITDPDDPRIRQRADVLERVIAGEMSFSRAAAEMGISGQWTRFLVDERLKGRPDPAILRQNMLARLKSEHGRRAYAKRQILAEPVFGNIKANLRFRRFSRRGMNAVSSEWRLICAVHNLLKMHAHSLVLD